MQQLHWTAAPGQPYLLRVRAHQLMAATLRLNRIAPEIREWCPSCRHYEQHANGAVQVPTPIDITVDLTAPEMPTTWACATQCVRCSWVTIYR